MMFILCRPAAPESRAFGQGRDGVLRTTPAKLSLSSASQGRMLKIRVAQLRKAPRVPPHWNSGAVR